MMRSILPAALISALAVGIFSAARSVSPKDASHYGVWGVDLSTRDLTVSPGDDFYKYAQGAWYAKAQIAPDQTTTGVLGDQKNRTDAQLRILVEGAAAHPASTGERKIGGLYGAFMNKRRLEALGAAPLGPDLSAVAAIDSKTAFTRLMAQTTARFGESLFGYVVIPDPRKPSVNMLVLRQDGLGLPDRDYYVTDAFAAQRSAYRKYVTAALTMANYPKAAENADLIMSFETKIAEVSWTAADDRNLIKLFNPMTPTQLQTYAPGVDWDAYFSASGVVVQKDLIVAEKTAIQKIAELYVQTPLETLKAWQAFHIIDQASPYLSRRFVDSRLVFQSALTGVQTLSPRWKRGVALVNDSLGEVLGQAYVARYFPPSTRAAVVDLVANLKSAMAVRIQQSSWMAPTTKAEALKKLTAMTVQIGYPDTWRDYSGLRIDPSDLYGDVERSGAFERAYILQKLNKAVDHTKWTMTPQTVNAYNNGFENRIVFPAAILQPPTFDPGADPAVNYGAAGAIIGHEITHGFDDQGRRFDETGRARDWWTPDDAKRFEAEAARLGAQYDGYDGVPGVHINGKLTMGENIADLGGLLAALDAYHASLHGQAAPVLDGLTGDQRFFLSYAQVWQEKTRPDDLKKQMASDTHSPNAFRVIGPLRNMDDWYRAFDVSKGVYALAPEARVRIW